MAEITEDVKESLSLVEDLKFFLATAPANWQENQVIRRYYLNNDEGFVSCVFWNNLYFITGTDIVRCILYKFQHFGRTVTDRKKFEEGIFSDLRNLKAGTDSVLENPKLEFLEFLYKNLCLRTQKKQKVFFWFNVPHDKLMADALERDIKKEKAGQPATSIALREPALLFHYVEDKTKTLYEQLCEHLGQPRFDAAVKSDSTDAAAAAASASASGSPEYDAAVPTHRYSSDTSYASQTLLNLGNNATSGTSNIGAGVGAINTTKNMPEEEDDDFPLDYLDHGLGVYDGAGGTHEWAGRDYAGRDYITLDAHPHSGAYINAFDSDFDGLDTTMFQNSVNVVSNDDYLIEQTVPARTAPGLGGLGGLGLGLAAQLHYPRLAKFYDELAYAYPPPGLVSLLAPYAYDYGIHGHEQQVYPHVPYEAEYPHPQLTPVGVTGYPYAHMDSGYPEDLDYLMRSGGIPSQRQQDVSATMMRKRRQLLGHGGSSGGVSKPSHRSSGPSRVADYEAKLRVQIKKEEEMLAAIPTPEASIHVATYPAESLHNNLNNNLSHNLSNNQSNTSL